MSTLERELADYLTGITVGTKSALAAVRLGTDLQTLVNTHGAVIRVRRVGGIETEYEVRPRVAVQVYAATYTDVWTATSGVHYRLAIPRRFWIGNYHIDLCDNESAPSELGHPNLHVLATTWRIVTRQHP